ncbi:MAG: Nramp family divalent metal transporter, partial [Armatimonadetes bacterium]|nr:Nramp family divalent metal transporter [Armatimonadota bacterium]
MKFHRHFFKRIAIFLSIMGPGIITANVDNDANGIATYSVAGASFGYSMLWYLIFIALAVALIQEMSSRMGCITGKGLADLIRENFGIKFTFLVILILFLANLANTVGNLAGLAAAGELFKIPKYISVIGGAFIIWLLVIKGSYEKIEKVFLSACLIYFTYIFSGILAHPSWQEVFKSTLKPSFHFNSHYLNIVIALVGTSIAPWMQFYQQSAVRDKGIRPEEYIYARYDTWIGTLMMMVVAFFIVVACAATLHIKGISINTAEEAALALTPVAGKYCEILFAIGLINAALFSTSIIPISTSYAICEAFGWESGIGQSFKEAKVFYFIY